MAYTHVQKNGIKIVRFVVACDFRDLPITSKKWGTRMNIHLSTMTVRTRRVPMLRCIASYTVEHY